MKTPQEKLNWRNKIAGTLGTRQVQEVLEEFLDVARHELKSCVPTTSDPHSYNIHRALGRVEELEFLIQQGKIATKPVDKEKHE